MIPVFLDSADGTRLRMVRWGEGERDLLLLHGLAEHAGRYAHVAAALVPRGWRVHLLELRGHGKSGGKRGHVDRWSQYVDDTRAAAATMRPGWCMVAHSMGGLVALDAVRDGVGPARLALSNPLLGLSMKVPRVKAAAGRLLSRLLPRLSMVNEIDPALLSRDTAVGEAYARDPEVFNTVTPRWYTEMTGAIPRVTAARYDLPIAMFVSDCDPINDPKANLAFAERVKAHVQVYPGMLHEIFNEIGKEKVLADVGDWLEAG